MTDTRLGPGRTAPQRFAELVARSAQVHAELAQLVADGVLPEIPVDELADLTASLHRSVDRAEAVATVATGQVDSTSYSLVAGVHSTAKRWLQSDAGLSDLGAATTLGRARDLRQDYPEVASRWLDGDVTSGAVREITVGVTRALRRLPIADRDDARARAVGLLLPVARKGTVSDVHRAVSRLRLLVDPDGARQAAMDAHCDQSLSFVPVGPGVNITGYLDAESAAAVLTVLDRTVDDWHRAGSLTPEDLPRDGVDPESFRERGRRRHRRSHLLALALGELARGLLSSGVVGTRHGVAPHVTLTTDVALLAAGLGGDLLLPGHDNPVVLTPASVRRILCDADVTPVFTGTQAGGAVSADPSVRTGDLASWLRAAGRTVLNVGRSRRSTPPRLRRALEVRDSHCAFPGCRVDVSRCHAHHVDEWELGGVTSLGNLALLCVRHHHAVHEGGWRIVPTGRDPGSPEHWRFEPPPPP